MTTCALTFFRPGADRCQQLEEDFYLKGRFVQHKPAKGNTLIYGASDDCIEVEGPCGAEEYGGDDGHLHFPCGTVVKVTYDSSGKPGCWEVSVVKLAKGVTVASHFQEPVEDGDYSERLELSGITEKPLWVTGEDSVRGPGWDWYYEWFTNADTDFSDFSFEQFQAAYDALHCAKLA